MSGIRRTGTAIILALGMAFSAAAIELPFGLVENVATGYNSPTSIAVSDINADGRTDVVICSPFESSVRVHFQTEASGLTVYSNIVSGIHSPYVIAVGDIDRDGDTDVVVGQSLVSVEAELQWIENPLVGGGGWTAHDVANFTATTVVDAKIADLDLDGFLDIAFATDSTGGSTEGIWVAWNDGTPGNSVWSLTNPGALAFPPSSLALADIDGDGDKDVAATSRTGDWVRWFDNPRTTSGTWSFEDIDTSATGAADAAIGDFDGDGKPDIAVSDEIAGTITWYENNGSWTAHSVTASFNDAETLTTADLDMDGDDDLIATSFADSEVAWFENDGTSGWSMHYLDTSFDGAATAAVGDLDDDGDLDVVAAADIGDAVGWWRNELIHRRFAEYGSTTIDDGLGNPQGIATGDVNNDGLTDVVYAEREGDRIVAKISVSTGGLFWLTYEVVSGFDGARDVAIADINNDGAPDIIGTAVADDEIAWWENDGTSNPSWTKHTVTAGLNGAHAVVAADFDGDGDLDIAAAGRSADQLRWYRNANGLGTSWSIPTSALIASIDGPYELVTGDLNGDGWPDLALTAYEGDAVKAFLWDPATSAFDEVTLAIMMDGPRGIDLADLDGDGDLDAVATIANDDQVRWWANDGTGTAWLGNTLDNSFDSGAGVTAADLDGDGDMDVVATSQSDDTMCSWVNTGDGSSWSTELCWVAGLDTPWSVVAAPIDNDGDLDLVVTAAGNADSVTWYSNVGGQFGANAFAQNPDVILDADLESVLYFSLSHLGRAAHDAPLEFSGITLSFTDSMGTPLTTAEAESLIEGLSFYRDYGDMSFDPVEDQLFYNQSALPLSAGTLSVTISDGLSQARVDPEVWGGFWVVIWSTADASLQTPSSIIVSLDEESILAEDADHDLPLVGEPGDVVNTAVMEFVRVLFADDFESGGTDAWDDVVP